MKYLAPLALILAFAAAAPAQRPNVVLVVTDDQPRSTIQHMPLTKSLLNVNFTNAYVTTPTCCPSRVGVFTGLYSHNTGVLGNHAPLGGATAFSDAETLAVWLQRLGYRTALMGKYLNEYRLVWWHVPPGWDEWRAWIDPAGTANFNAYHLNEGGVKRYRTEYVTDYLFRRADDFIRAAPADRPFFLYVAPPTPHDPYTPSAADRGKFSTLPLPKPPNFDEEDVSDKPSWVRKLPRFSAEDLARMESDYRSVVESVQSIDRGVKKLFDALESTGRLDNTVFIFTSDNGMAFGQHRLVGKHCPYDVCVRVPLLMRAPGVPSGSVGGMVANIDLAPTILELAGSEMPLPSDGVSFVPLLRDPAAPGRPSLLLEFLWPGYNSNRLFYAVRKSNYVYVEYLRTGERELYNLALDPHQLNNIYGKAGTEKLTSGLQKTLAALKAQ